MPRVYTHYDNLKVARNAPPEVIRAAYKILSQKFHPDRNPGDREAARIMAIINASYEVLSDPERRREHDLWIQREETNIERERENISQKNKFEYSANVKKQPKGIYNFFLRIIRFCYRLVVWLAMIGIVLAVILPPMFRDNDNATTQNTAHKTPAYIKPTYEKPASAPNGSPWPSDAGYIKGYPILSSDGLSELTIDNSRNDSDVFVKLFFLSAATSIPVRVFYIPAYGKFTLKNISVGTYDIRYRDLSNGALARSESFSLKETVNYNEIRYSNMTMTLYKVSHGNMQTYGIKESDF